MAVTLMEVVVQVSTVEPVLFVIPAVGAVVFEEMLAVAVAVQPLAVEIPVTV